MKLVFQKPIPDNPRTLIRRLGYGEHRDPRAAEWSYVRRLSTNFYPRFHVYIEETDVAVSFNLHLDMKQPSYAGTSAHAGEYDGPLVEREAERIRAGVAAYQATPTEEPKKKSFWSKIFGS